MVDAPGQHGHDYYQTVKDDARRSIEKRGHDGNQIGGRDYDYSPHDSTYHDRIDIIVHQPGTLRHIIPVQEQAHPDQHQVGPVKSDGELLLDMLAQ